MRIFTTGQVAKICKVAPRTVSKWFDSKALNGYRIPGSKDRRIPEEELRAFIVGNEMPIQLLDDFIAELVKKEEKKHQEEQTALDAKHQEEQDAKEEEEQSTLDVKEEEELVPAGAE